MGRQIDMIAAAARVMPSGATVLPGGSVGVFDVITDGVGYRFVPEQSTLLYSLSPGAVRTECGVGLRHRYSGTRPNAAFNLIPAGETYQSRTLQLPAPLRFASVTFFDAELRGLMQPGADLTLHTRPKLVVEDGRVDLLVRLLAEAGRAADPDDALVRSHALLALAAVVLGPASAGPASGNGALDAKRLALARAYIESRMQMDISLAGMAAAANLSVFHFARAFKQATGLSPAAYARQRRMERARALLRSTNLPLAEVGRLVGYADPARFSHRFRAEVGLSPSAYRRR